MIQPHGHEHDHKEGSMKFIHAVVGLGLLTMCGEPPRAYAVNLTGTWVGKIICDSFDPSGKFRGGVTNDTMEITQTGADLNIVADEFLFLYNGQVIDDPANPAFKGQAGFIECRTTPANTDTSEMGRLKVVVKGDGINARLKARSILMNPDLAGDPNPVPVFQTCKWSYKRIDTTDPVVPGCDDPLTSPNPRTENGHH